VRQVDVLFRPSGNLDQKPGQRPIHFDGSMLSNGHDQGRNAKNTIQIQSCSLSGIPTTRPLSGFLSPELRKQRHRPTNSQISLKPEGDVFLAGSDSAQQLLALYHAVVSDPGYLKGWFRE
jgi:hypothetical protein